MLSNIPLLFYFFKRKKWKSRQTDAFYRIDNVESALFNRQCNLSLSVKDARGKEGQLCHSTISAIRRSDQRHISLNRNIIKRNKYKEISKPNVVQFSCEREMHLMAKAEEYQRQNEVRRELLIVCSLHILLIAYLYFFVI